MSFGTSKTAAAPVREATASKWLMRPEEAESRATSASSAGRGALPGASVDPAQERQEYKPPSSQQGGRNGSATNFGSGAGDASRPTSARPGVNVGLLRDESVMARMLEEEQREAARARREAVAGERDETQVHMCLLDGSLKGTFAAQEKA
jgi:hypothetical protein